MDLDLDFDSIIADDGLYTTEEQIFASGSELMPSDYAPNFDPEFLKFIREPHPFSPWKGGLVDDPGFDFLNEFIMNDSESEPSSFLSPSSSSSSSSSSYVVIDNNMIMIPRSPSLSVSDKMTMALSLFNLSAPGTGILAQVWIPSKRGNQYVLSTCAEPHLVDPNQNLMLAKYREVSKLFKFCTGCCLPGLPGRVFSSKLPEWTSNVAYYTPTEYLRVEHAIQHEVRGSMAIPVFEDDSVESPCCAVLELVTVTEKQDFHREMETLCSSLKAVNLRSVPLPRFHIQSLSMNQSAALAEINDVLGFVCEVHQLPLALTWVTCNKSNSYTDVNNNSNGNLRTLLCIEESGCYVKDKVMEGFVHACEEHYLEQGQGIAGKALLSDVPLFIPDVKSYDISNCPYVHHARKFGLSAVVAIKLTSTYTGDDHYIIELFLPINLNFTGNTQQQQQHILNSLVSTIQIITFNNSLTCFPLSRDDNSFSSQHSLDINLRSTSTNAAFIQQTLLSAADQPAVNQMGTWSGNQKTDKKRNSTTEKKIAVEAVLEHFPMRLIDASKNLGVCPTTLKRICRQYGILRWPYRKINKVNNSMNNIIKSAEGVEGGLKFDPTTGGFVAALATVGSTFSKGGFDVGTSSALGLSCNGLEDALIHGGGQRIIGEKEKGKKKCTNNLMGDGNGDEGEGKLTVKASYKEDIIRFKMEASGGCEKLYEEIGMRLKLQISTFNVKYLDDEKEWVMLGNDSDMKECLEILHGTGSTSVKLLVGDIRCSMGSYGYDQ